MKRSMRFLLLGAAMALFLGSIACDNNKAPAAAKEPAAQVAAPVAAEAAPAAKAAIEPKKEEAPLTCDDGSICPVE